MVSTVRRNHHLAERILLPSGSETQLHGNGQELQSTKEICTFAACVCNGECWSTMGFLPITSSRWKKRWTMLRMKNGASHSVIQTTRQPIGESTAERIFTSWQSACRGCRRGAEGGPSWAARGGRGTPPGLEVLEGPVFADTHHAHLFNTSARNNFSARNSKEVPETGKPKITSGTAHRKNKILRILRKE